MSKPVDSNELIDLYERLKRHETELHRLRNETEALLGSMREHEREMSFYRDSRARAEKANAKADDSQLRLYDDLIAKLRAL
jgi:chromosome segregation ATPase